MGLDAYVNCKCYQEGKTKPPPFPLDWLEVDKEFGVHLFPHHDSQQNWLKLEKWKETCCPHPDMHLASEWIANWTGYRLFQYALNLAGQEHFPTLHRELPNTNGGQTSPAASQAALAELDFFQSLPELGVRTVLVDSNSDVALYEYNPINEGLFLYSPWGYTGGINETGFYVIGPQGQKHSFQSRHFRQIITTRFFLFWKIGLQICWRDLETGKTFTARDPITGRQIPWPDGSWKTPDGRCNFETPTEFHVEQRLRTPADFDRIVTSLRILFTASIQSGNPVFWC